MRSLERLEQQKRLKQIKQNQPAPDWEMEEELEQPRFIPLNKKKNAFDGDDGGAFGGINSAPSAFRRFAVFPDE